MAFAQTAGRAFHHLGRVIQGNAPIFDLQRVQDAVKRLETPRMQAILLGSGLQGALLIWPPAWSQSRR